jgi:hypothetical protein
MLVQYSSCPARPRPVKAQGLIRPKPELVTPPPKKSFSLPNQSYQHPRKGMGYVIPCAGEFYKDGYSDNGRCYSAPSMLQNSAIQTAERIAVACTASDRLQADYIAPSARAVGAVFLQGEIEIMIRLTHVYILAEICKKTVLLQRYLDVLASHENSSSSIYFHSVL